MNSKLAPRPPHLAMRLLVGLLGCALGVFAAPARAAADAVAITSIKTDAGPEPGTFTIRVTVDYKFTTKPAGVVYLGFDLRTPNNYELVTEQRVANGRGTVELSATLPSSVRRPLTAYVNLSAHPHAKSWNPLAATRKPLALPSE